MVDDFKCNRCSLHFSVGQYHYHRFESGYGGRALFACGDCGTQHAVELALRKHGGPEHHEIFKLVVTSVSVPAEKALAKWLRRETKMSIVQALETVRNPPFVLVKELMKERADKIRVELEPLGAGFSSELIGTRPNPFFGSAQNDRLLYHAEPRKTAERPEWLIGPAVPNRAALDEVACRCCGTVGALSKSFKSDASCPSCKEGRLALESSWIT